MSQTEEIPRKDKRALRDAERHKQGKKRKRAEVEEPVEPQDKPTAVGEESNTVASAEPTKAAAKDSTSNPQKKRRKSTHEDADDNDTKDSTPSNQAAQKPSKSRFIVFVGNLPYKTTDTSLRTHFSKLEPFVLRHRTDPKTKQSKGFAFLEFENYDRMKTCLKLYHHSMFDPATASGDIVAGEGGNVGREDKSGSRRNGKKTTARRINVELTAGGGGKTEGRKEKIRAKNMKLEDERKRRVEAERKEKERKEKKEGMKKKASGSADGGAEAEAAGVASHGIHPSRLARINV